MDRFPIMCEFTPNPSRHWSNAVRVHPLKTYEGIPHVLTLLAEESDQVQVVAAVLSRTIKLEAGWAP
jgi:hypothetical protein